MIFMIRNDKIAWKGAKFYSPGNQRLKNGQGTQGTGSPGSPWHLFKNLVLKNIKKLLL
jgi:hypothetical protein